MKKTYLFIVPALISFTFFSDTLEVSADSTITSTEVELTAASDPPISEQSPDDTSAILMTSENIPTPEPTESAESAETATLDSLPTITEPSTLPIENLTETSTPTSSQTETTLEPSINETTIETTDSPLEQTDSFSEPPNIEENTTTQTPTTTSVLNQSESTEVVPTENSDSSTPEIEIQNTPAVEESLSTLADSENLVQESDAAAEIALLAATTGPSQLINQVNTDQKVVSLTISGVSDDAHIDAILQNLATLGIKATFFINGSTSQAALNNIVADGHEIGNHAYTGVDTTGMTVEQLTAEVTAVESVIQNTPGATASPYFRAPGGITNTSVLDTVGSLGYGYTIGWSIDPWDWSGISSSEITSIVTSRLAAGSIILLDAGATATGTPTALLDIVSMAKAAGFNFATITGLLAYEGVYTDEPVPSTPSQLIDKVDTNQKVVSLTISGVSDDAHVDAILQNLAALNIKATFFVNGSTSQAALSKIAADGHEIGNHAYSGVAVTGLTSGQLINEIAMTGSAIQSATGVNSQVYFRAPGGITNASVLETVGSLGYDYTIGWSIDPWDWSGISSSQITSTVISKLAPGSIILLDAGATAIGTPAALLDIVGMANNLGYAFTTLNGLLAYEGVYTEEPVPSTPSQQIDQVSTNKKVVSLTFDDGNDANNLKEILDTLLFYDVKATFFLNGATDPVLLNRIIAEGHQLGNHTYYHGVATEVTEAQLIADIYLMENYILTTTGTNPQPYFRAPAGYINDAVLATVGSLGYTYTIGWTIDPWDWSGISASQITSAITGNLYAGGIYLLHASDTATGTPDALAGIISQIKAQGYEFKTIEQLLTYEGDYSTATNDFVFPDLVPFDQVDNPMWTRLDVTDVSAPMGVADPFIVYDAGVYHMFFEVIDTEVDSGYVYSSDKIAHAWSTDLVNWTYTQVIVSEEQQGTRAAYPSVFNYQGSYYMVPDLAGDIESFVATDFPLQWEYNSTLMEGSFVDTNVFNVGGVWYLTTSEYPYNSIGLYYNTSGDWRNDQWVAHPAGLIIEEDAYEKGYRGAGNPFVYDDYVVMPVQITPTDTNIYGERTYWYKLSDLSPTSVTVENLGLALGATNDGTWTDVAIHHIAHAPYGDGYIFLVDGYAYYAEGTGQGEYTIGMFIDANFA